MDNKGWVQKRLRWEDWELLRNEVVILARKEVKRRKWRGSYGGLLPEGYDAESVAAEAIQELLSGN